ncbi:MAG: Mth938-like domain-containing protein [Pseudomonadota bacterium]
MKSQLSLDPQGPHHFIRAVSAEGTRVGETLYTGALIVGTETLIEHWPCSALPDLTDEQLEPVFALEPEVVLLGTGARQAFLPPERLAPFYRRGVGIEMMTTDAACRTFNVLASEGRRVVAALLPIDPD